MTGNTTSVACRIVSCAVVAPCRGSCGGRGASMTGNTTSVACRIVSWVCHCFVSRLLRMRGSFYDRFCRRLFALSSSSLCEPFSGAGAAIGSSEGVAVATGRDTSRPIATASSCANSTICAM